VLGLLLVNGAYIWYNFKDKTPRQYDQNKKATWMLVCLFVINAPTFQRAVPASYIQVIVLGGLSVLELLVWLYLYCQPGYKLRKRRRRVDYGPVRT
jgi:hypothetical protein